MAHIRSLQPADHVAVLAINNAAVPAMNTLTRDTLERILGQAAHARVLEDRGIVSAFLIGIAPHAGYESANYRWFSERYASFLYIDRVAVAVGARRAGFGGALYADAAAFARDRWECLLAEVNLEPPNPESVVFHERQGFEVVGELAHAGPDSHAQRVAMMRRALGELGELGELG